MAHQVVVASFTQSSYTVIVYIQRELVEDQGAVSNVLMATGLASCSMTSGLFQSWEHHLGQLMAATATYDYCGAQR